MKLLIVTRKVDIHDERMGFFVDWINEFAKHIEKLTVISMQEGTRDGVEASVDVQFIGGWKLAKYVKYKKLLKELVPLHDGIFVHMIPLYTNLAGPLSVKHDKKLFQWYMHRSVDNALWQTQKWVNGYITASKKSFRLKTKLPVHTVGHAIPIEKFRASARSFANKDNALRLLTVSRISPAKHIETIIEAVHYLETTYKLSPQLTIVGAPALKSDEAYLETLKGLVEKRGLADRVVFVGPRQHDDLPEVYAQADVFINTSETGSIDKAVLEAMASGCISLTSNEAFQSLFAEGLSELMFSPGDYHTLAQRIVSINGADPRQRENISVQLQHLVAQGHDLKSTIVKIVNLYEEK